MFEAGRRRHRRSLGFTLIELLVVMAIIAILAAMLMPALESARAKSLAVTCRANMRQQGLAFHMYTDDNNGCLPSAYLWKTRLLPYVATKKAYVCPCRTELPWYYGHGYNIGCPSWEVDTEIYSGAPVTGMDDHRLGFVEAGAEKILVVEWDRCLAGPPIGKKGALRGGSLSYWAPVRCHEGASNVLFCDGHVVLLDPSVYHSSTTQEDGAGAPVPSDPEIVDEETWRRYWDPDCRP